MVPYAVPSVVAALMWGYLYGPDYGPFAQLSKALHVPIPHFLSSGWMGKGIFALLALFSLVSWTIMIGKAFQLIVAFSGARLPRFAGTLWHGRSCDDRDNGPAVSRAEEKL